MTSPFHQIPTFTNAVLLFSILLITGCGDDPKPVTVVGTWQSAAAVPEIKELSDVTLVEYLVSLGYSQSRAEAQVTAMKDPAIAVTTEMLVFNEDGTYTVDGSTSNGGTWEITGDMLVPDTKTLILNKGMNNQENITVKMLDEKYLVLILYLTTQWDLPADSFAYNITWVLERL